MNYSYVEGYMKCPECGEEAKVDTNRVLTSFPAQYEWSCPHCKASGYILCSDSRVQYRVNEMHVDGLWIDNDQLDGKIPSGLYINNELIASAKDFETVSLSEKQCVSGELQYSGKTNFQMYQMISDESELRWFFDHVIQKPAVNESYSMVFVSRHKKLTKEEQKTFGLTRKESEFLATQSIRLGKFKDALYIDEENNWTFENFLKRVKRFNVDKGAYTTGTGEPLPEKTLAVIFYVNPCDDIKVADALVTQINDVKTAIAKAMLNGKTTVDNLQSYQMFGNLENNLKHFKANQKGTRYWLDFDIDVPKWFKDRVLDFDFGLGPNHCEGEYYMRHCIFEKIYGKGNFVIIDTSGGYHVLVKTSAIKSNPHDTCKKVETLYYKLVSCGGEPYLDDNGNNKFECVVNDSQIPGLPLPGTYQYGRPVTVLNKEDFK